MKRMMAHYQWRSLGFKASDQSQVEAEKPKTPLGDSNVNVSADRTRKRGRSGLSSRDCYVSSKSKKRSAVHAPEGAACRDHSASRLTASAGMSCDGTNNSEKNHRFLAYQYFSLINYS